MADLNSSQAIAEYMFRQTQSDHGGFTPTQQLVHTLNIYSKYAQPQTAARRPGHLSTFNVLLLQVPHEVLEAHVGGGQRHDADVPRPPSPPPHDDPQALSAVVGAWIRQPLRATSACGDTYGMLLIILLCVSRRDYATAVVVAGSV
eukprot:8242664-Pyramimonas_sp.AAC.1